MILPIVAYGDPVLRRVADDIEQNSDLKELLANMFETMYGAKGVGLAAPQIGKSIRLFIVDASPFAEDEPENDEEAEELKALADFKKVFVNPVMEEETGEEWDFQEGCLSIPDLRESVDRKERIKLTYFDENWKRHTEEFDGVAARIIQHEYDHIEGKLFIDYVSPLKRRLLKKKLADISKGKVDVSYKMKFPLIKKGR